MCLYKITHAEPHPTPTPSYLVLSVNPAEVVLDSSVNVTEASEPESQWMKLSHLDQQELQSWKNVTLSLTSA